MESINQLTAEAGRSPRADLQPVVQAGRLQSQEAATDDRVIIGTARGAGREDAVVVVGLQVQLAATISKRPWEKKKDEANENLEVIRLVDLTPQEFILGR